MLDDNALGRLDVVTGNVMLLGKPVAVGNQMWASGTFLRIDAGIRSKQRG